MRKKALISAVVLVIVVILWFSVARINHGAGLIFYY